MGQKMVQKMGPKIDQKLVKKSVKIRPPCIYKVSKISVKKSARKSLEVSSLPQTVIKPTDTEQPDQQKYNNNINFPRYTSTNLTNTDNRSPDKSSNSYDSCTSPQRNTANSYTSRKMSMALMEMYNLDL